MDLIIENVRCFHERQQVPIRPLTLLVGENSSGKTTFLAAYRIAMMLAHGADSIDFNREPFEWGSFEDILYSPLAGARARAGFSIGIEGLAAFGQRPHSVEGRFHSGGVQPALAKVVLGDAKCAVTIDVDRDLRAAVRIGRKKWPAGQLSGRGVLAAAAAFRSDIGEAHGLIERWALLPHQSVVALAAVRPKPQRVYSKFYDYATIGGEHMPQFLKELLEEAVYGSLAEQLLGFGQDSGLFDELEVPRLGSTQGSPLQVLVRRGNRRSNLVDVGYGVAQALPILVDSLRSPKSSALLLQQPEVHLHPRAQAQLGTFFATVAKAHKKTFIVETHSDHLVDRVRMDIRDKKGLKAEDVALLYFERTPKNGVKIHRIELDSEGNVIDPPESYRAFFAQEDSRFFGVPV